MNDPEKSYNYSMFYKLNFIPGLAIISFLLTMVYVLPSTNKLPGYIFSSGLLGFYCLLWFLEKRKVAQKISIDNECILGFGFYTNNTCIPWENVDLLRFSGKGSYLISGKIEKFLYAEVVAKDKSKIVIRGDIQDYKELVHLIETKANKKFCNN